MVFNSSRCLIALSILITINLVFLPNSSMASAKYSLYLAKLTPSNHDVDGLSPRKLGIGLAITVPLVKGSTFSAVNLGLEHFRFYNQWQSNVDFYPYGTVGIEDSQDYYRIYAGSRIGLNGKGRFRPFIGSHLALTVYTFGTGVFTYYYTGGDMGQYMPVGERVYSRTKSVFGYDFSLGAEIILAPKFILESGVRYLNLFSSPEQLNDTQAITVQRDYYQFYLSIGALFGGH